MVQNGLLRHETCAIDKKEKKVSHFTTQIAHRYVCDLLWVVNVPQTSSFHNR